MKKWIRMTALALAALLALAGCGKKQEPAGDRLAQIQQKGELVIALEGNWAPWSFHDDSDALVGYDVEVGKAIAEKLGVKATFVEGEWDGLLAGVEAGRYDMVINGVDITDSRKETYDFSTPYAYIKTALVVAKDNDTIQSFEDLAGKTTANSIGSTYMEMALMPSSSSFSILAALGLSLWEPMGRIRAFLDCRAAVSMEVPTPTPTSSGGPHGPPAGQTPRRSG